MEVGLSNNSATKAEANW